MQRFPAQLEGEGDDEDEGKRGNVDREGEKERGASRQDWTARLFPQAVAIARGGDVNR